MERSVRIDLSGGPQALSWYLLAARFEFIPVLGNPAPRVFMTYTPSSTRPILCLTGVCGSPPQPGTLLSQGLCTCCSCSRACPSQRLCALLHFLSFLLNTSYLLRKASHTLLRSTPSLGPLSTVPFFLAMLPRTGATSYGNGSEVRCAVSIKHLILKALCEKEGRNSSLLIRYIDCR